MKHILSLPIIAMMSIGCVDFDEITPWLDNFNETRSPKIAKEVRPFIIKRQGCDHFRGEPPYDEERREFLLKKIEELCTGTDAELQRLREKYSRQPETMKALADFEDCIEFDSPCTKED